MGPGAGLRGGASGTATHQADASLARELSLHPRGPPAGCDLHPPRERGSQRSGDSAGHVANGRKGETGVPGLPSTQPQGLLGHAAWPGLLSRASRAALKALVTADAYRVPHARHSPRTCAQQHSRARGCRSCSRFTDDGAETQARSLAHVTVLPGRRPTRPGSSAASASGKPARGVPWTLSLSSTSSLCVDFGLQTVASVLRVV